MEISPMRMFSFGVAIAVSATAADAATVFFDRPSWEAALGADAATLTLDSFDNDIASSTFVTFDSGVASKAIGGNLSAGWNAVSGGEARLSADGLGVNGPLETRWIFPTGVRALAFDFGSVSGFSSLVGDFDGTGIQAYFPAIEVAAPEGFFGIIGAAGFDTVSFLSAGGNDNFSIDNLAFGGTVPPPAVVPLPASLPLLIGGVGAMVFLGRRRKAAQTSDSA
jgi:hypothetical protein